MWSSVTKLSSTYGRHIYLAVGEHLGNPVAMTNISLIKCSISKCRAHSFKWHFSWRVTFPENSFTLYHFLLFWLIVNRRLVLCFSILTVKSDSNIISDSTLQEAGGWHSVTPPWLRPGFIKLPSFFSLIIAIVGKCKLMGVMEPFFVLNICARHTLAILRRAVQATHYRFSLRGMERWKKRIRIIKKRRKEMGIREKDGPSSLAGDVKQPGAFSPLHLQGFWLLAQYKLFFPLICAESHALPPSNPIFFQCPPPPLHFLLFLSSISSAGTDKCLEQKQSSPKF